MTYDDMDRYLDALQREPLYRVDEVLKESEFEETQLVSFMGVGGEPLGPYIRKVIKRESGLGNAYDAIYEAQALGRRFAHIPRVVECYRREDALVVVTELAKGITLEERVRRAGPSLQTARAIFPALCDAVREIHEDIYPPLIHRDLKPSNIMVDTTARPAVVSVIDFDISRSYNAQAETDTVHFGTRTYAPPEQFGFGQTTVRSDVYALGMVLFYCLAGEDATPAIRESGFSDPRVPERLRYVLSRASAFDPAMRYSSAIMLKQAFGDACRAIDIDQSAAQRAATETASISDGASGGYPVGSLRASTSPRPESNPSKPPEEGPPNADSALAIAAGPPSAADAASRLSRVPFMDLPASHKIGRIWNCLLMGTCALFCVVSFSLVNSPDALPNYTSSSVAFGYGVIMPLLLIGTTVLLLDKRRLKLRFGALERMTWWKWIAAYIVLILVLVVLTGLFVHRAS